MFFAKVQNQCYTTITEEAVELPSRCRRVESIHVLSVVVYRLTAQAVSTSSTDQWRPWEGGGHTQRQDDRTPLMETPWNDLPPLSGS